jgi:hypothetical protein
MTIGALTPGDQGEKGFGKKTNEDPTSWAYRSKAVVILSAKSNCFSDTAATSFCIAVPSTQTPRSSKGTVAMEIKAIANR